MPSRKKGRGPDDPTRIRLLESGAALLLQNGPEALVEVRLSDACEHAELTTGAAYPLWATQKDYQADLARHVASSFSWVGPGAVTEEVATAVEANRTPEGAIRQVGPVYLKRFVAREEYYLSLRFLSVRSAGDDVLRSLRANNREIHEAFRELYAGLLDHYRLGLVRPRTLDELTLAAAATTEGMAVRYRTDADSLPVALAGELYAEMLVALLHHFTKPKPTRTRSATKSRKTS
jgi:hypothetical protein